MAPQQRVQLYDALRGFCLFGVLWSNLNDWFTVMQPATPLDHRLQWIQDRLLEERFYSMLGFLFGIGFAIQLTRAEHQGNDVRNLFLRRMAVLLAFGLVHALFLWDGDILIDYAVTGAALLLFRRLSPGKLLVAALAVFFVIPYLIHHLSAALGIHLPFRSGEWQMPWAYAHGTWAQVMLYRIKHFSRVPDLLYANSSFLVLFILGLWAVRVDLVPRLTRRRIYIFWSLLVVLAVWGVLQYLQPQMIGWYPVPELKPVGNWRQIGFWAPGWIVLHILASFLATCANSAAYALSIALAMSFPAVAKCLQPLAMLGRMTLTTYLTQSLVITTLFYGWGLGLMNSTNLSGILFVTVVLFSIQIAFSVWWLKRYRFGPVEWLWRSLAYGKRLPNRIAPVLAAANVPA